MQSYTHTYLKIWRLFDVRKMSVRARSSAMLFENIEQLFRKFVELKELIGIIGIEGRIRQVVVSGD